VGLALLVKGSRAALAQILLQIAVAVAVAQVQLAALRAGQLAASAVQGLHRQLPARL
jgi:hypothetical protein